MKIEKLYCALLLCGAVFNLAADERIDAARSATASMVGTALFRADVALAKSIISPNDFRGSLGENVAGQCFLKNTLSQTGNWQAIMYATGKIVQRKLTGGSSKRLSGKERIAYRVEGYRAAVDLLKKSSANLLAKHKNTNSEI